MNYNHLHYFHCIAKAGSVTAAAKSLNISQPALSAQLKELERNLNAPLFIRTGRNLRLTLVGRKIYAITKQIFTFASQIPSVAASTQNNSDYVLRIGVTDDVEFPYIAGLICDQLNVDKGQLAKTVTMTRCTNEESFLLLENESLDLTFAGRFPRDHSGFFVRHFELPVYLTSQYGALPAVDRNFADLSISEMTRRIELLPWDLILPSSGSILREETDTFLTRRLIRKNPRFESSSIASVIRAIAEGIGFGFLPGVYCEDALRLKRVQLTGPKNGFWKSSLVVAARETTLAKGLIPTIAQSVQSFHARKL